MANEFQDLEVIKEGDRSDPMGKTFLFMIRDPSGSSRRFGTYTHIVIHSYILLYIVLQVTNQ